MANPQYPMPQMQPMQPMGQMPPQPQGGPPTASGSRRGTSRVVPVVVSAGLAVGVFCGLLFGLGTGDDEAVAAPSSGNNVKSDSPDEPAVTMKTTTPAATASGSATSAGLATTTAAGSAAGSGAGSGSGSAATTTAAAGSGSGSAAGSGSGATTTAAAGSGAGSTAPAATKYKLTIEVKPDEVAEKAKITIDKADVTGGVMEIDLGTADKKLVKVVVKAAGYKTVEQKVEVEGDTTVKIELIKRPASTGPRPGGNGTKPPGGGLIDI